MTGAAAPAPGRPVAPELTVIIPTSGRWPALERTLDALGAQTVSGFAVTVVVNDLAGGVPESVRHRPGVRVLAKEDEGPGVARNLALELCQTELVLFLGDDTIPVSDLVERHLRRHRREPGETVAVLGRVRWHPEVARGRVNRFLDWSGSQYDYDALDAEFAAAQRAAGGDPDVEIDAGFGRCYTSNLSLKRSFCERFDPDFRFGYEDIDLGHRLSRRGLVVRYEPRAVVLHHHAYGLAELRRRFELVGEAERTMVAKHDWFEPVFADRFARLGGGPRISPVWAGLHDLVPRRIERLWWPVHARAERWYHQELAEPFRVGWERALDLEELRRYLGDAFSLDALRGHTEMVESEWAAAASEVAFYTSSEAYLYDLTVFAMSGTKLPYHETLRGLVPAGARLLDVGAGIGADALRLLARGYRVSVWEYDNPSLAFLRWRLSERGLTAPVHVLGSDAGSGDDPGTGYHLAYAFDVLEHVADPLALLEELESRASLVLVNLLEPVPGDLSLHHHLPIRRILARARARGLVSHQRLHGRVQLIAYRGTSSAAAGAPASGGV